MRVGTALFSLFKNLSCFITFLLEESRPKGMTRVVAVEVQSGLVYRRGEAPRRLRCGGHVGSCVKWSI